MMKLKKILKMKEILMIKMKKKYNIIYKDEMDQIILNFQEIESINIDIDELEDDNANIINHEYE